MDRGDVEKITTKDKGHFNERIWESISFALYEGKTIRLILENLTRKNFHRLKINMLAALFTLT